uniref:Receptor ligand binding region domain-containing protein n=1 Tax=Podarcis muralis TaxID=64176 RepID=A0A670JDB3_PODMU
IFPIYSVTTKFYQNILALVFAIKEINDNPKILPNVTLGFHIYDSYSDARMTYRSTLDLLFKRQRFVPNYKCDTQKNLMALTYGSFASEEIQSRQTTSFYSMVPKEIHQYVGIIHLLQYFRWIWVGLFVSNNNSGEHFLRTLELLFSDNGICSAFTKRISLQAHMDNMEGMYDIMGSIYQGLTDEKTTAVIFYGDYGAISWLRTVLLFQYNGGNQNTSFGKVWIMTAQIDFLSTGLQRNWDFQGFQGALSFTIHSKELLQFNHFLQNIQTHWTKANGFRKDFWEQAFDCFFPDPGMPVMDDGRCTGEERLESLPAGLFEMHMTGQSYSIYNAACAVAHALHAISSSRPPHRAETVGYSVGFPSLQPWQVIIRLSCGCHIGKHFHPQLSHIFVQVLPFSLCNEACHSGHQKKRKEGEKFCCYDCAPCPAGKISNQTDMDACFNCPEDQYPNKKRNGCIPKVINFLSYEEPLGITLASLSVLSCCVGGFSSGFQPASCDPFCITFFRSFSALVFHPS